MSARNDNDPRDPLRPRDWVLLGLAALLALCAFVFAGAGVP